jgi:bacterioferritin-associated ferredoxin
LHSNAQQASPASCWVNHVYVCICNGVTDHQIREAAEQGVASVAELTMRTGCGATCGSCLDMAAELLDKARNSAPLGLPVLGLAKVA